MANKSGISRRGLLKLGAGTLAAGSVALPRIAQADEVGPVPATVRRGAVPIIAGDSIIGVSPVGYGAYQGGIVTLGQVPDISRGQMQRVNLQSAGANLGVRADWFPVSPINMSDAETFEFWAYLDSPKDWPNGDPTSGAPGYIYFFNPNSASYFTAYFTLRRGWNFIRIGRERFTGVGSPSWNDSFLVMRTSVLPCTSGPISAYFGDFRKLGRDRSLISIMFDDGEESARLNGLPILQNYGIPATVAVISGNMGQTLGSRTFTSLAHLGDCPAGTGFVNHTVNHRKGLLNTPRASMSLITAEIQGCQTALAGLPGFDPACFAAPYGEWSDNYLEGLRQCGVQYSRCAVGGSSAGYRRYTGSRIDNPLLLCSFTVTPQVSPAELLQYVDWGIASCQSMIIVFHDIRTTSNGPLDYPTADLAAFAQGLSQRSGQVDFVTLPTMCNRLALNGMI